MLSKKNVSFKTCKLLIVITIIINILFYVYYGSESHVLYLVSQNNEYQQKEQDLKPTSNTIASLLDELHSYADIDKIQKYPFTSGRDKVIDANFTYPHPSFFRLNITNLNPICKYLFPDYLFYFTSHKNGVYLSHKLIRSVSKYCKVKLEFNLSPKSVRNGIFNGFDGSVIRMVAFQQQHQLLQVHGRKLKALIQIRHPIDTIWSAFNYHRRCPMPEPWAKLSVSSITRKNRICCAVSNCEKCTNMKGGLSHSKLIKWNDQRLLNDQWDETESLMKYDKNGDYMIKNTNVSYCDWLNAIQQDGNAFFGFYIEFVRYINCENGGTGWRYWKQVFAYIKQWNFIERFEMKQWSKEFDSTAHRFMDFLNLIDDEENRKLLTNNGLTDFNITYERQELFKILKLECDINAMGAEQIKRSNHMYQLDAKYLQEKQESIAKILGNNQLCLVLKNLTMSLDFEWEYEQC